MEQKQKEIFRSKYIFGELFLSLFVNAEGYFKYRTFKPDEITDIETCPNDIEEIWSYQRQWVDGNIKTQTRHYRDIGYDKLESENQRVQSKYRGLFEQDVWIYFTKYGESYEKRGRPEMYPMLRFLRLLDDMIGDRAVLQHEKSRIMMKKKIKGRSSEETTRIERPPKGGYVLVCTDTKDYEFMVPSTAADDAKSDSNLLKYAISAGFGVPFFVLDQNPENMNYASILEAGTPFVLTVLDEQDTWKADFENIFRFVLEKNVELGKLPAEVEIETYDEHKVGEAAKRLLQLYEGDANSETMLKEVKNALGEKYKKRTETVKVPLSINFPEVVRTDQFQLAQVLKIYAELGLASLQTLSEKAGFNFKEELFRIAIDKKRAREEAELAMERYKKGESFELPERE